jgi:hypothetical protein
MSICEPAGAERRQVGAGAHGGENEGMQVAEATAGGPNRVPGMDRREPPAAFEIRRPSRGQEGEGCSPGVSPPTPRAAGEMVKDGESLLPSNPQKIKNAHPVFSLFCGEEPQPFHQVSPFHQLWTASAFHSVVPPAPGSPVATRLSREIARKQPPTRLPPRRSQPWISAARCASQASLFFDGSHRPCTRTTPHGSSRRISAWEIHPVYAIEVCINTSLSGCPRTDATKWQPLHKWLQALEEEEEGDEK